LELCFTPEPAAFGALLCSLLSDNKQRNVGNDIEDQENKLKEPEEGVNDHIKDFPGNGKPFALRAVHQIRSQYAHCGP
jgi:hypothetical protein